MKVSSRSRRVAKRLIDVVVSSTMLVMSALAFVLIAVAVWFEDRGSVFFCQERVGINGRCFKTWKFRTMTEGAVEKGLGRHVAQDDPWITRVGRFLREWGLDELPQLANVLMGDMSLVGPRPVLPQHVAMYTPYQYQRLAMKPGITGWALIHGRNRLPWRDRIELDVWYVEHWTLWLDLRILIMTIWIVLIRREGAYGEGDLDI